MVSLNILLLTVLSFDMAVKSLVASTLFDYTELNQKRFDHIFISDLFDHRRTDRRRTDKYTTRRTQCCFIFTLR